jgi:hypothetical protein
VRALLLGGFGGQSLVVALDVVQVTSVRLISEQIHLVRGR